MSVGYGRMTGRFMHPSRNTDGSPKPVIGFVLFTPSVTRIFDAATNTLYTPEPFSVALRDGSVDELLLATDFGNPTGWTWTASFHINDLKLDPITFEVESGGLYVLPAMIAVEVSPGQFVTRGPAGIEFAIHGNDEQYPRPDAAIVHWIGEAWPAKARPYDFFTRRNIDE